METWEAIVMSAIVAIMALIIGMAVGDNWATGRMEKQAISHGAATYVDRGNTTEFQWNVKR